MVNEVSYNIVIERLKAFASGHLLIKQFTHGDPANIFPNLEESDYPLMHVTPTQVAWATGERSYSFTIIFADIPRDKETAAEYQREIVSDCLRLAEDLLAEVKNGGVIFGEDVTLDTGASATPFMAEYTHTLTGIQLTIGLTFPYKWSACDIPANWAPGGSGSGGSGGGFGLVLKVNSVNNVLQNLLNIVDGTNTTVTDLGDGRVRIDAVGGAAAAWGSISGTLSSQTDLQNALDLKADISSLATVATSGDYNDLTNLPTIPSALNDLSDVTLTSPIGYNILRYDSITDQWINDTPQGIAGKINLDDLDDVDATTPTNGQALAWNNTNQVWEPTTISGSPTGAAGGDLTGTYPNPTVHKVHGVDMQSGTPQTDSVWVYGGSPNKWQHQKLKASQVDNDSGVSGQNIDNALDTLDTDKQDTLVSGTNIKTIEGQSLLGSGNIDLTKTDVGLGNVDDTSDLNKPISTATQTALNAKQGTLVSGTNIKTINNTTILGSGNLSVVSASSLNYFGDGSAGIVTINTNSATLLADTYYQDLTITGSGSLNCKGFRVFVSGTLDLTGAGASGIHQNGLTGASTTGFGGGTNGVSAGKLGFGRTVYGGAETSLASASEVVGGNGGSSATGNGVVGGTATAAGTNNYRIGGAGGSGGKGGNGPGGTGGNGSAGQVNGNAPASGYIPLIRTIGVFGLFSHQELSPSTSVSTNTLVYPGLNGGGGGGGAGSGTQGGGGGGAGGGGGGNLYIYAKTVSIGASTNSAAICANGASGGNGAGGAAQINNNTGGGGGGAGGGGGYVFLLCDSITGGNYTFISANGGSGGTGGDGRGTGIGAQGGSGGSGGRITVIKISTSTITHVNGTTNAGTTPTAPTTGTAGTAGGSGGTCTYTA